MSNSEFRSAAAKESPGLARLPGVDELERLYHDRYIGFRNALATVTGSYDAARDAVQEGFARAIEHRDDFRGGSLAAWVWRIALRAALDTHRRDGRPLDDVPKSSLLETGRDPRLEDALRALSPRRRLIVFLRYFADFSYEEIAQACDVRVGTVAATLAQARRELARALEKEEEHDENLLADRLAAVANPLDDSDWLDVQRRARTAPRRQRRGPLIAVVVAGTLILAGGSLALGYELLDLSVGDPAPPKIQQVFDSWDQHRLAAVQEMRRRAGVTRSVDLQTRRARLAARIRARNGRRVLFWAAPTTRGWCWALQYLYLRKPVQYSMEGGCAQGPVFAFDSHSYVGGRLYAGRVRPRVATLELRIGTAPLRQLPHRRIPLRNGFYLFDAPEGILARIIGRDAQGRVLFVRKDFA